MRSPLTSFRGEYLPRIGHNQGPPLEDGQSWRAYSWKKARKELVPRLPLEVVQRRVRRATALGLEYPQYASILLGTGRDVVAFLFTSDSLGLRLARTLDIPTDVARKLTNGPAAQRLLGAETEPDARDLTARLASEQAIRFDAAAAIPNQPALSWTDGRDTIRSALAPLNLPADAVVMVGTRAHERTWADAASLAKFLPAESYFPAP